MPKGVDPLKPGSPQWERRQAIHRHNGFVGSACMMKVQLQGIIEAETTTPQTKSIAIRMLNLTFELMRELQTRKELYLPPGEYVLGPPDAQGDRKITTGPYKGWKVKLPPPEVLVRTEK